MDSIKQLIGEYHEYNPAIFLLGGKVNRIESFTLDGAEAERTLIKIEKVSEISKRYPRKAGVPGKEPLK